MAKTGTAVQTVAGGAKRAAHPNRKKAVALHRAAAKVPAKAGGLGSRAMLVALTVRRWHIGRNDSTVDGAVGKAYDVEDGMGSYRKLLVRKEAIAELRQQEAAMRELHYTLTLAWGDDGYRILSNMGWMQYTSAMNAAIEQYYATADTLVAQLEELKADAKTRLGKLYKESDYPSAKQLRKCYYAKVSVRAMPDAQDFRVELGSDADVEVIRQQIGDELQEQLSRAHRGIWERLQKVIANASERLKAYEVSSEGKVSHAFRESLLTNVTELLDIIPILNVLQDKELDAFTARIRAEITSFTVPALRASDEDRAKVVKAADDILAKMQGFLA